RRTNIDFAIYKIGRLGTASRGASSKSEGEAGGAREQNGRRIGAQKHVAENVPEIRLAPAPAGYIVGFKWVYTLNHRRSKGLIREPLIFKERPTDSKKPNRRGFLKDSAALAGLAAGGAQLAKGQTQGTPSKKIDELIAYGERSRFVTSIRVPVAERHSPDEFGLTFHVLTPLQDSAGIITPNSLFYTATHRGAFVPDIDPREHRLMIHGMVDRPMVFTMDELKRL